MIELDTATPYFADKQDVLNEILSRYPEEGRRSALMPLLWEVQRNERYISEARMHEIGEIVGITATEVKGVLSFYSTYHEQPVGKYHIQVCSTLSCALAGADEMYDHLVEELGIVNGETDADGRFSLQKAECVGSCGTAPVLLVNDTYYERVTRSRCQHLLEALRRDDMPEAWRERGGDTLVQTAVTLEEAVFGVTREIEVDSDASGDIEVTLTRVVVHPLYFTAGDPIATAEHIIDLCQDYDKQREIATKRAVADLRYKLRYYLRELQKVDPFCIQQIIEEELGLGDNDTIQIELKG